MTHDHTHGCCGGHDHDHAGHNHAPAAAPGGRAAIPGRGDTPILVEVTRGGMVESRHRGHACVVDAGGRVLARWGETMAPVYPRSAVKALQAIPLVESGAFDAFGLGSEELALACASHNGEAVHTDLVARWLARIGCTPDDLECGAHLPYDEETTHALLRAGAPPTALHNNCSGKHAGMLTTARHRGEAPAGYVRYDHPVQQRILGVLEQMTAQDLTGAPWGVDGCSIPTLAVPLGGLAFAMARIADPSDLPERRAAAVERIRAAWAAHPYLIAGRNTFDTRMMETARGRVLVKAGAEGVGCAVLVEQGVGIALKIEDGAARARDVAMAALIRASGALDDGEWDAVPDLLVQPQRNRRGTETGAVRPAAGWPVEEEATPPAAPAS
ncbi:asparaginase [Azospirillum halopraeferens]|uniref:asparaginase n=1 Tax=Azospirillum halopraeferens TaxID=34010 RepID=UPI00041E2465|nr:asparaginase [Azospirillum halopraeferens]